MKPVKFLLSWMLVFFLAALSACNGGGSGAVSALTVAEKVSVVDAQNQGGGIQALVMGAVQLSGLPASSDYNKDKTAVYIHERSVETFNIVNEILCAIAQTRYDQMVNKGDYKALINIKQCSSENGDASSAGQESQNQSSGSTRPEYEMWTVNSSRADNNSPQIIKVWVHEEGNEWEPAKMIFVNSVITEGKNDTNPYGIFTMNFKASPVIGGVVQSVTMFKGIFKSEREAGTGKILLKFLVEDQMNDPNHSFKEAATLDKASGGAAGAGTLYHKETHPDGGGGTQTDEKRFNIAFNSTHFLRQDAITPQNPTVCLSRTDFEESAWRYGLYDETTGTRLTRNSGFSIKKDNAYGWVGYWGLWLPEGVTVNDGDTAYQHDYQTNTNTPYTVVRANGKLKKHTRKAMVLGDIKNIPLYWWEAGTNYQVVWTGAAFNKVAVQDQQNYTWTNLNPRWRST